MKPGRRPALSRDQVLDAGRLRLLPTATRPREAELAARYVVNRQTLRLALLARPPYDFGDSVPPLTRARDRRHEAE